MPMTFTSLNSRQTGHTISHFVWATLVGREKLKHSSLEKLLGKIQVVLTNCMQGAAYRSLKRVKYPLQMATPQHKRPPTVSRICAAMI
jgi:hypothetical protein